MCIHSDDVGIVLNPVVEIGGHLTHGFTDAISFQSQSTNCYLWLHVTGLTDVSPINVCRTGGIVKAESEVQGGISRTRTLNHAPKI